MATDGPTNTVEAQGDWDVRGRDLDTQYARFGLRALHDHEICALSIAAMVTPEACPGAAAYLTYVSRTTGYVEELKEWGMMLARGIAASKYKARNGFRRRTYIEGYTDAWGAFAVRDALAIAFLPPGNCPGINERAALLGIGVQGYVKVRNFVAAGFTMAVDEFRMCLAWAYGMRRDSLLQSRWGRVTGLKWNAEKMDATMGREGDDFSLFASGCDRTSPSADSDERRATDPETLYPAVEVETFWHPERHELPGTASDHPDGKGHARTGRPTLRLATPPLSDQPKGQGTT